jgi:glycosyltransferase involved in cell wall biosynthesis
MNVLQLSEDYYPVKAGGAFVDTAVAESATDRGYEVTVVTLRYQQAPRKEFHNGVRIRRPVRPFLTDYPYGSVPNTLGRLVAALATGLYVLWYLANNDTDVIYSTNHFLYPVSKTVAVAARTPLVSFVGYTPSLRDQSRRYTNPMYVFEQINFRFFLGDHVHCRTPEIRDRIATYNPGSTVQVTHGILKEEPFLEARATLLEDGSEALQELRAEIGVDPDVTLLLYVGSLESIKRPEAAVEIVAELPVDYELAVVGDGERLEETKRTARKMGVSDRVAFLGEQPHVKALQWMLSGDVLLLTSAAESYSAVVLEALACSCRVVASPVGIIPEIEDEIERVEMCPLDSMKERIEKENGAPPAWGTIDEEILASFSMDQFTDTICDSLLDVADRARAGWPTV